MHLKTLAATAPIFIFFSFLGACESSKPVKAPSKNIAADTENIEGGGVMHSGESATRNSLSVITPAGDLLKVQWDGKSDGTGIKTVD